MPEAPVATVPAIRRDRVTYRLSGSGAGSEPGPCGLAFTAAKRCRTDVWHQAPVTVMPIQHDRRDLHVHGKPVMDGVHHRAVPPG